MISRASGKSGKMLLWNHRTWYKVEQGYWISQLSPKHIQQHLFLLYSSFLAVVQKKVESSRCSTICWKSYQNENNMENTTSGSNYGDSGATSTLESLAISRDINKNHSCHCHFKAKSKTINYFQQESQKVWIGVVQNEHLKNPLTLCLCHGSYSALCHIK